MGLKGKCSGVGVSLLLILTVGLLSVPARGAFLYKSYVIKTAGDQEVLCDPYIVQKDDYVLKIFRQRGEISNDDFPEFLEIFKAINPQIEDINKVLPGQHLFIPLKKLEPASVPDQEFGVVTIPFVTSTDIDDILKDHGDEYVVQRGDTVSKLLSTHFGQYGTDAYAEGLSIFKAMNPQIEDLNLILVGQQLVLPNKSLQNELWYESLFDAYGNVAQVRSEEETVDSGSTGDAQEADDSAGETETAPWALPLTDAAEVLDAKLYLKGTYFFPRDNQSDFKLDLTKFPVLETRDGGRVMVSYIGSERRQLTDEELSVLKSFWKDLVVARVPEGASLSRLLDGIVGSLVGGSISEKRSFTKEGIRISLQPRWMVARPDRNDSLAVSPIGDLEEKTPQPILEYLQTFGVEVKEIILSETSVAVVPVSKEAVFSGQVPELDTAIARRDFARNFYGAIGINYQENVRVSFEYAGIQIQAVTNALNREDGLLILVDFGDLQGEAIATLEKAGFQILLVPAEGDLSALLPALLDGAGYSCEKAPVFNAAQRSGEDNTTIEIPGFLVSKDEEPQVFLSTVPVNDFIVRFFKAEGIEVVTLVNADGMITTGGEE
jgi:hypothetical protein